MNDEPKPVEPPYEVIEINRADAPSGVEGTDWHHYVIAFEGSNSIQGYQPGNLKAVRQAVDEMVAQLNERHMGKRGRVNLVPTPKKKTASR
jgi:hypothetical protein